MWTRSPIWSVDESPSGNVGMSDASSRNSARSRPDIASPVTGGVNLATVADSRITFESITEMEGSSSTFAVRAAAIMPPSPHALRAAR